MTRPIPGAQSPARAAEFSLVRGGPLFDLWCRFGLADAALGKLPRRIGLAMLLAWVPLLALSLAEGKALDTVALPFLRDIETHVRFLVALPLLIAAEVMAHRRMLGVAAQFLERDLIPDAQRARFDAAIASLQRWRDSRVAEAVMLALVYGVGVLVIWGAQVALHVTSWYGVSAGDWLQPSAAGWWLALVSLPLFQFLLVRWYYRLILWVRFLWQVSRLDLQLVPTHPDRCGGLSFLGLVSMAFGVLVMAQSAVLAGIAANRMVFVGADLMHFRPQLLGWIALMLIVVLGPLVFYARRLEAAARIGKREYGTLAQRYANEFDRKWLRGGAPAGESLLGSPDIQSLADMGGSLEVVQSMHWVPISRRAVAEVLVMTLLPFVPLMLSKLSAREVAEMFLKLLA